MSKYQSLKRPKINIPKTKSEWIWDVIGYGSYVAMILLLIIKWNQLPERIPGHFNAAGEVDRWGAKWELFILPCIGIFIAIFMQVLERFPEIHNYPSRLNESNAKEFYLLSRKLLNKLKNISLLIFASLLLEIISISLGWSSGSGAWWLPITILVVMYPIIEVIIKQRKIK